MRAADTGGIRMNPADLADVHPGVEASKAKGKRS